MTQETKLTEPVQVGLWYQTKAGAIVKIDSQIENYIFTANNGLDYLPHGDNYSDYNDKHDLIKCLGADPFNQVVSETIVFQKNPCIMMTDKGLVPVPDISQTTPTLHYQVAMAALQGLISRSDRYNTTIESDVELSLKFADEFMRQKNERENV